MPILNIQPFNSGASNAVNVIYRGPVNSWPSIRNATSGTGTYTSGNTNPAIKVEAVAGGRGTSYYLNRIWAWYDVVGAGYPAGASINQIDLNIATDTSPGIPIGDIMVVEGFAFGNNSNAIATTSEFGDLDFNQNYLNSPGGWNNSFTTNTYSLNSTARNFIIANGYLGVCVIDYNYDYQDVDPYGGFNISLYNTIDFNNVTKCTLQVDYTAAGYGNEVNGITGANIGEVNGISSGDINQVNGL